MKDKKEQLGMLYVILSGILFGTMPLLAKIAYAHGSNAYSVAFVRFLSGTILLFIITMLLPGCKVKIGKEEAKEIIKLSFFYALAPILLYLTYNYMDPKTILIASAPVKSSRCELSVKDVKI